MSTKTPGGRRAGGALWRYIVVGGAGVLLGVAAGTALADPTSTDEYAAVVDERDQLEERSDALSRNAADAERLMQEAQRRAAQAESDAYQAQVDVEGREEAVAAREAAVTATEEAVAAAQIPGSGRYVVGQDVAAGEYRTSGGRDGMSCYYAFLDGTGSDADIVDNDLLEGATRVTLRDGDVFETSRCSAWEPVTS